MQEEPTSPSAPASATETTGDAAVDEALRALEGLETRPVHEHVTVIDDVHRSLQERLADEPPDGDDEPPDDEPPAHEPSADQPSEALLPDRLLADAQLSGEQEQE